MTLVVIRHYTFEQYSPEGFYFTGLLTGIVERYIIGGLFNFREVAWGKENL